MSLRSTKEMETLGDRLRSRREELELTVTELAQEISAPEKYVQALEENRYGEFSAKIYALGYLKKICGALAVSNHDEWIKEFTTEWDIQHFHTDQAPLSLPGLGRKMSLVTPKRIALVSVGVVFLLVTGFIASRLTTFVRAPKLTIEEPQNEIILNKPAIQVKGGVEKESHLTVNGREITIDQLGNFDESISVSAGLTSLEFNAENRFGKKSSVIRNVFVE